MSVETNPSIFCSCGGLWLVKNDDNETRILVCPMCGKHQALPDNTSMFQLKIK
ncbi:MAG: hypothetical protein ACFFE8_04970 [Candidatus Heimdallarchaeota archaeon]